MAQILDITTDSTGKITGASVNATNITNVTAVSQNFVGGKLQAQLTFQCDEVTVNGGTGSTGGA
jgi:hypothetical protein